MQTEVLERCDNCRKQMPQSKIGTHLSYCRRNIKSCKTCGELYDINFQEDHAEEFHKKVSCPHCKTQFTSSDLQAHESICNKKPKFCEYCEMDVPKDGFDAHFKQCQAMTRLCDKCRGYIMNKDFLLHSLQCKGRTEVANPYAEHMREQRQRIVQNKEQIDKKVQVSGGRNKSINVMSKAEGQKAELKPSIDPRMEYRVSHEQYKAPKIAFVHKNAYEQPQEDQIKRQLKSQEQQIKRNIAQPSTVVGMAGKQTLISKYNPIQQSKYPGPGHIQEQYRHSKPLESKKYVQSTRGGHQPEIYTNKEINSVKPQYQQPRSKQIVEEFKKAHQKKNQDKKYKNEEVRGYEGKSNTNKFYNQAGMQSKAAQIQPVKTFQSYDKSRLSNKINEQYKEAQKKVVVSQKVNYQQSKYKPIENQLPSYYIKPSVYSKKNRVDEGEVVRQTDNYYRKEAVIPQKQHFTSYFGSEEDENLALAIEMSLKNSTPKKTTREVDPLNESFTKQIAIYEDIQRKNKR